MPSFTTTMVGASFHPKEAKDVLKELSPGTTVTLRADPDNQYDSTAVAVDYEGTHIGFIPASENGPVFDALMEGEGATAEIIAFESTIKPILEITWDE